MEYNILGKNGPSVSRLCFGTLTVGPLQKNLSVDIGGGVMAHAIDRDVNFFDTAQLYGTYKYIKKAMDITGKRDIVVSSKTYAHSMKLAAAAVEQARKELDRDYIDIFMLHEQESIHTLRGHSEALEYLYSCKAKGIIKSVGLSTHHVAGVLGGCEKNIDVIHPLINMAGLGIVDGSLKDMENAIEVAAEKQIGIFAMKSIGGGNLIKDTAKCFDYVLSNSFIGSVAVGMQSIGEVDANIRYFESGHFSDSDSDYLISKKRRLLIHDWCEGCGSCVDVCKSGALKMSDGVAVCDPDKCVLCGYCGAACSVMAIKIV